MLVYLLPEIRKHCKDKIKIVSSRLSGQSLGSWGNQARGPGKAQRLKGWSNEHPVSQIRVLVVKENRYWTHRPGEQTVKSNQQRPGEAPCCARWALKEGPHESDSMSKTHNLCIHQDLLLRLQCWKKWLKSKNHSLQSCQRKKLEKGKIIIKW